MFDTKYALKLLLEFNYKPLNWDFYKLRVALMFVLIRDALLRRSKSNTVYGRKSKFVIFDKNSNKSDASKLIYPFESVNRKNCQKYISSMVSWK